MKTKKYIRYKNTSYTESDTKKIKRLISTFIVAIVLIISAIIFVILLNKKINDINDPSHKVIETQTTEDDPSPIEPEETTTKPQTPAPQPETTSPQPKRPSTAEGPFSVTYIADGDTIHINYYGSEISVRFIGVNTPETVDQRTAVQCFGIEASNYLKSRLTGQSVYVERDYTQSDYDKYGRMIRYVYLGDEDMSLSIIANGYGYEYTYYVPYSKQSEYQAAEQNARSQGLGLWSPSTCNGST